MMKKNLLNLAVSSVISLTSTTVFADLPEKANLSITGFGTEITGCLLGTTPPCDNTLFNVTSATGSFFALGGEKYIEGNNGVTLGIIQAAANSHSSPPDGSEIPNIDLPWEFAGNTGMHQTTSAVTIISDDGSGTVELAFSGWDVTWNGIANIPMGGGVQDCGTTSDGICVNPIGGADIGGTFDNGTGIAVMTCEVDCSPGESFVITSYAANVPQADASGFGGAAYTLHLEGFITDTNLAPVASFNPLITALAPNASTTIDLAGNVTDPDGDGVDDTSFVITYTGSRSPVPTITDDGNGSITYTDNDGSDTGAGAPDTFTYTVKDNLGKVSATLSVEVAVVTGNIPPIAQSFPVTTDKDQAIIVDVIANVTDNDGTVDASTVQIPNVVNGSVTNVDSVTGDVTFLPDAAFIGTASFDYRVRDNSGDLSNIATVTVNVNDPPVATDTTINVDRNTTGAVIVSSIASDSDGTLDLTTIMATDGTVNGGTTSVNTTTGEITYTPPTAVFIGPDEYTYTIDDNNGATSNTGTVTVMVNNIVPAAVNDSAAINIVNDANVIISVLLNDTDVDGTIDPTTVIATAGSNGTTTVNASGQVTYTPDGSLAVGQDTFTYTVKDNDDGTSNVATVTVNISSGVGVLDPAAFLVFKTGLLTSDKVEPPVGDGSWFTMELDPGNPTHTSIAGFNHVQLGTTQIGTVPAPDIDQPWLFAGNLGVHQTTSDLLILTDDGAGNVALDFSVWDVSWNSIPSIPLGAGADNGIASMTCAVDCSADDTFVLDYRATVPPGDPSGFGNVKYRLHLEGVISVGAPSFGGGDPDAPYTVTDIVAFDSDNNPVDVSPGATAVAVGNVTGVHLSVAQIGNTDPLLNPNDGEQCTGGCADFVVSGVTTDYVDIVLTLVLPIREGSKYRKLINGKWADYNVSEGGQIGSAADNGGGICQGPEALFEAGLRGGYRCVFMRIYDGGPNDADGVKNGTIVDPSGVLLAGSPNVPASSKSSGAMSWMSIAFVLSLISLVRIKRT